MFIGREKELRALGNIISSDRSTVGVIYGRRRIGKSELIKKAFDKEKVLIFEGLENRPKQDQLTHFVFQLIYQARQEFSGTKAKTWQEAFLLLYQEIKHNRSHIVFDEFQWMANYRSEIVSELKPVWDQYISKIPGITLILCGSIASFMTTKVVKSSAFYGRTDLVINLKGFLLPETKDMLKGKGNSEIIEAQMLLGGIPKYLDLIREKPSIRIGMEELAFTDSGYFVDVGTGHIYVADITEWLKKQTTASETIDSEPSTSVTTFPLLGLVVTVVILSVFHKRKSILK